MGATTELQRRADLAAMLDAASVLEGRTPEQQVTRSPVELAKYLKIEGPDGDLIPFVLWGAKECHGEPGQREFVEAILAAEGAGRDMIAVKARQLGFTWGVALIGLHDCIRWSVGRTIVLSQGQEYADEVLERVRLLYNNAEPWIRDLWPIHTDKASHFALAHGSTHYSLRSFPSTSRSARSLTAKRLILDENAHLINETEVMAAAEPTQADIGMMIRLSTANGVGGDFHQTWQNAVNLGYDTFFASALARPDRNREKVDLLRKRLKEKGPQEYPYTAEEAFVASGNSFFDLDELAELAEFSCWPAERRGAIVKLGEASDNAEALAKYDFEDRPLGHWWVWEEPKPDGRYVAFADSCMGPGGEDFAACAIYDLDTRDQVAAFHGRFAPDPYAKELMLAGHWYNTAMLVPERNGPGHAVLAVLLAEGYGNVYYHTRLNKRLAKETSEAGWPTDVTTRPTMEAEILSAVHTGTLGIRDAAFIAECQTFIVKINEAGHHKAEAQKGCHDDRVITHMMAAAFFRHSPLAYSSAASADSEASILHEPIQMGRYS